MRKSIPVNFTKNTENQTVVMEGKESAEELTELMKEMKGVWKDASNDLLKPRAEVLDQLLKKVLH